MTALSFMELNLTIDCDKNVSNKKLRCFNTQKHPSRANMMHSELEHAQPMELDFVNYFFYTRSMPC